MSNFASKRFCSDRKQVEEDRGGLLCKGKLQARELRGWRQPHKRRKNVPRDELERFSNEDSRPSRARVPEEALRRHLARRSICSCLGVSWSSEGERGPPAGRTQQEDRQACEAPTSKLSVWGSSSIVLLCSVRIPLAIGLIT